jgi:uncharacterized membrane protein SpoIIM required for sporulation
VKLERFLDERQPGWTGLEALLREAGAKPERLGPERLRLLGRLYRAAAADLAFARRAFPHDPVTGRLERLVIDARQAVYSDSGSRRSLRWFLHTGYWQRVLEQPWPLAIAVLLMFGPIVLAAVWAMDDPAAALGIVPAEFQGAAEPGGVGAGPLSAGDLSAFSVEIFTNNIRVTFLVVAGGILGGLGTAAVTIYNGGFLGAILGLTIENGSSGELLRLVLPHGLLELSCIVVAACAGLRIGWALVEPGTLTRGQSLRRAAGPAMEIVLGTMPWLVLAGLVEGFVSGKVGSLGGAIAVGVGLAVLYWSLVAWRGRPGSEPGASLGPEVGVDAGRGQSSRGRLDHAGAGALEPVGHAGAGG